MMLAMSSENVSVCACADDSIEHSINVERALFMQRFNMAVIINIVFFA
jgi:hypothetical protein